MVLFIKFSGDERVSISSFVIKFSENAAISSFERVNVLLFFAFSLISGDFSFYMMIFTYFSCFRDFPCFSDFQFRPDFPFP